MKRLALLLLLLATPASAQQWQCFSGTDSAGVLGEVACAPGSPNCKCTQVVQPVPVPPVAPNCAALAPGTFWNGVTCQVPVPAYAYPYPFHPGWGLHQPH